MSIKDFGDQPRCVLMVGAYRFAHFASVQRKRHILNSIWTVPVLLLYRIFTEIFFGYEIPAATRIGKGLKIDHGYGLVINKHSIIGDNCRIKHFVTIGCKTLPDGSQGPSPIIGSNVDIGVGAIILGGVTVGDNVMIGAGAIVTRNVPSNSVVRSVPSSVYEQKSCDS